MKGFVQKEIFAYADENDKKIILRWFETKNENEFFLRQNRVILEIIQLFDFRVAEFIQPPTYYEDGFIADVDLGNMLVFKLDTKLTHFEEELDLTNLIIPSIKYEELYVEIRTLT